MGETAQIWRSLASVFESQAAPRLPLDEWAAKYRRVVGGPRPGPWNPANAPMSIEPMRMVSERSVSQVTICAPAQLMKSEFAINVAVWIAANGQDVLFYEPNLPLLKDFLGERIRPAVAALGGAAIVEAPDAGLLKNRDSTYALRFGSGGTIRGLTPEMKSGKISYSAPVVVIDEIDKMGDPTMITVAASRTTAFEDQAKIVVVSTPTEDVPGSAWRLWSEGSRGVWKGQCQHCRELVSVGWGRVKFDKDEDGFWLPRTAAMVCESCGTEWTEADRQRAVRTGQFVHDDPEHPHRSYHIPGPAHLWQTLEKIVVEGAKAWKATQTDGDWESYRIFINERLAEVWTGEAQGLSARRLQRTTYSLGSRGAEDLGELDRRTVLVTAGVDVGGHDILTEFVGWGIDPKTGQVLSWGLLYRQIGGTPEDSIEDPDLWREFEKLVDGSKWRHAGWPGIVVPAQRVMIDAGYRPDMVREFCEARYRLQMQTTGALAVSPYGARILPSKSKSMESGDHPVDLRAGMARPNGRTAPRFPALVSLESGQIKDMIYTSLLRDRRLPEGAPRANHWPTDREARGYTEAWYRQFTAERKTYHRTPRGEIKVQWETKFGTARQNHAWDARIYAAGAMLAHVWPHPPQSGLIRLALADAAQPNSPWTAEEAEALRRHLAESGGGEYTGGNDNVMPLR